MTAAEGTVPADVLAVDFGTANTYLARAGAGGRVSGIDLAGGRDGMATAILYRQGRAPLIGDKALEEYGEASPQERAGYRLCMQFKPDLVASAPAREAARDFLAQLPAWCAAASLHLNPLQRQVIFGVPADAPPEYVRTLAELAEQAGFGRVHTREEPLGALFFHLAHQELPTRAALAGGLVVDFGGGTCDLTYLERGQVSHSWGDFTLGGRLFDDLFFQWFLESDPDLAGRLEQAGDSFFVHACLCRELKEAFSRTMERDRSETLRRTMGHWGRMDGLTWEGFILRARAYRLSPFLRRHWQELGVHPGHLAADDPVDLLAWFGDTLARGWTHGPVRPEHIRYAILTGGSSQWPFVRDALLQALNLPEGNIIRSSRPYAAIAEGLAALPEVSRRLEASRHGLEQELPAFLHGSLQQLLAGHEETIADSLSGQLAVHLFDARLQPAFEAVRQRGGSIAALRDAVAEASAAAGQEIEQIISREVERFLAALALDVQLATRSWFAEHGLSTDDGPARVDGQDLTSLGRSVMQFPDLFDEMATLVNAITTLTVASISASLAGGAGTALVAGGPAGLVAGGIAGALLSYFALRHGMEKARGTVETRAAPAWLWRQLLSTGRQARLRQELVSAARARVAEALARVHQRLLQETEQTVRREIDALREVHQLAGSVGQGAA